MTGVHLLRVAFTVGQILSSWCWVHPYITAQFSTQKQILMHYEAYYVRVKIIQFYEFIFITAISSINIHSLYLEYFVETLYQKI